MEIKANLYNLRMAPRKVRLVANMVKGMPVERAQAQLTFLVKKPAPLILKLVNSAVANAKNNFQSEAANLFIKSIMVEAGSTLKRWLPRAMGRASAIHKRTCSIRLILGEIKPSVDKKKKTSKPRILKAGEALPEEKERLVEKVEKESDKKSKEIPPARPFDASSQSKKKNFSRQTGGGLKKVFRRKSI
jgi:large subunit ribosomal protein L22